VGWPSKEQLAQMLEPLKNYPHCRHCCQLGPLQVFSMSGGAGSTIGEKVRLCPRTRGLPGGSESFGDLKGARSAIGTETQVVGGIERKGLEPSGP
jgi:hypothetical protein